MTQFDLFEGMRLREVGEQQAHEHAPEDWRRCFEAAVLRLAQSGEAFTADDVIRVAGLPQKSRMNKNNAVGAVMHAMAKSRVIVKTGRMRRAERRQSHARELREWVGRV